MINSAYTPPLDLIRRPRRNRQSAAIRALVRENRVHLDDLIQPLFVKDGNGLPEEIPSLPGMERLNVRNTLTEVARLSEKETSTHIILRKAKATEIAASYAPRGARRMIRHISPAAAPSAFGSRTSNASARANAWTSEASWFAIGVAKSRPLASRASVARM